jgi:hypothetical protein
MVRDEEVVGSNPATPTAKEQLRALIEPTVLVLLLHCSPQYIGAPSSAAPTLHVSPNSTVS